MAGTHINDAGDGAIGDVDARRVGEVFGVGVQVGVVVELDREAFGGVGEREGCFFVWEWFCFCEFGLRDGDDGFA